MSTKLDNTVDSSALYGVDFYRWAQNAARDLRVSATKDADRQLIADEIEDMAKRERRELKSRMRIVMAHLLKWSAQPEHRRASWQATINEERNQIQDLLEDSPSLRPEVITLLPVIYEAARELACIETSMPPGQFPPQCPFSSEQVLDPQFWPDSAVYP